MGFNSGFKGLIEGPDDGLKHREVETCSPGDIINIHVYKEIGCVLTTSYKTS